MLNSKLKGRFTFGRVETGKLRFTGLKIQQYDEYISVDHIEFIQSIKLIEINRVGQKDKQLNKTENKAYRTLTGQLSWVAQNTRPDLSYDARDLTTRMRMLL